MNPRLSAWRVLTDQDAGHRHLEVVLSEELDRHSDAEPRRRATAFNLVYTVLRNRLLLDHRLRTFVKRALEQLDAQVLWLLRLGAAEMSLLGKPPHGVVNPMVELAKNSEIQKAAGLINGALRAFAKGWEQVELPDPATRMAAYLAVKHSHPPWLVTEMIERMGSDETEAWIMANQQPFPLTVRTNTLRTSVEALRDLLASSVQEITGHDLSPLALVLRGVQGPMEELPGFNEGLWQAQDPGSQATAALLGVEPGMEVLDLCAGAGGKSGALAALMNNQGRILAVDTSPGRLEGLAVNMDRLGVKIVRPLKADGASFEPGQTFDRVLVDAPCTGLGTLGRRPDIRWRIKPKDPARLAKVQLGLLSRAVELVKPGGAVLYVTCTMTEIENQSVVGALLAQRNDLSVEWGPVAEAAFGGLDADGFWRTAPHRHLCDAFFAARLVKAG